MVGQFERDVAVESPHSLVELDWRSDRYSAHAGNEVAIDHAGRLGWAVRRDAGDQHGLLELKRPPDVLVAPGRIIDSHSPPGREALCRGDNRLVFLDGPFSEFCGESQLASLMRPPDGHTHR